MEEKKKRKNRISPLFYYPPETHRQINVSIEISLKKKLMSHIAKTRMTQRDIVIEALEEYLPKGGA